VLSAPTSDIMKRMDTRSSDSDTIWAMLEAELSAWSAIGRSASFWWRDDDATASGPKLGQLISLTQSSGLLLAVIPNRLEKSLISALAEASHVRVAQHGYEHINHAPRGQGLGAWELGLHRGVDAVMSELDTGRECLQSHFGLQFLPVVVPPWNRIATELMQPIASRGYKGVSAFGPRTAVNTKPNLIITNAHCDPIRWKGEPKFRGLEKTITQLTEHLSARRTGLIDADEPTGFLTHHIDLDDAAWDFCARLVELIDQHSAAHWLPPQDVF